jgi:dipeptidyl aminopeptidase/acylaminoacyl peptidase
MHRTSLLAALVTFGSVAWGAASEAPPPSTPTTAAAEQKPALRALKPPIPLADYFDIRRVRGASFSHDEKLVAYRSDEGGRLDIWVQPVRGGKATQVSQVKGVIHAFAFSPVNDTLLVEADDGGNDETRLYFTDSKGKAMEQLLPDLPKGSRAGFIRWAEDGRSLLYIIVLPGQDFTELREYNLETRQSETIWKSPPNLTFALASRDLKRFVLAEILSDVNFNLYLLERGGKEPVLITPHEGDAAYTATSFSADGKTLYYTSTAEGEFTALYAMDLATKTSRPVLKRDWDVEKGEISSTGRYLVTVTNVDGTPEVKLQDPATGRELDAPRPDAEGAFVPVAFSRSDRYMAATLVTDVAPETLYVVDLETGKATRMVEVLPASLRGRKMVAGKAVQIPTFDHWKIPALLYQPEGEGPFPAVIDVHGGPHAQAKRTFTGIRQYLVSKGYAVLVPNVRGSTGYGKTFTSLDNLDLGGGPLKDIVACKQWLIANARVAPDRVAILGASYGGYMALAAATFTPTEFAAHVDHFGISDFKALVESYPAYWAVYSPFTFKKYGDPKNPDHARYQYERSPIHHVDRIQRPLLVVQGENDARVPKAQSERLVDALRGRNVPVHYLLIPGEGHGFTRNDNRLKAYEATDRFLDRYLLGDTSVQVLP